MTEKRKRRKPSKKKAPLIKDASNHKSIKEYLSTGSILVDLIISGMADPKGRGGIPVGRMTEIFGPESSGKTLLAGELCGSAQRQGFDEIHMIDTEGGFEFDRASVVGLDVEAKNFIYHDAGEIETVEQLMGIREKKVGFINRVCREKPDKKILFLIDTVVVLPSELELKDGDKRGQSQPKAISGGLRTTRGDIAKANATVIFLNQVRQKPVDIVEFGHKRIVKYMSTGGQAPKHYPGLRLYLEEKGPHYNDSGVVLGVNIWSYVYKSRCDVPYRSCTFTLDLVHGIDNIVDSVEWLRENTEVLGKKNEWLTFKDKKIQSKDKFISYIEDNDLEEELFDLLRTEWRKFNTVPDRKEKKRI